MSKQPGRPAGQCGVCQRLDNADLIELDLLMSDPARWPASVWGDWQPPSGGLGGRYRAYGAFRMGRAWLDEHPEYKIGDAMLRRHLRFDVAVIDTDPETLIARGLILRRDPAKPAVGSSTTALDPLAYMRLYNEGILLGLQGLNLLNRHVAELIEQGDEVPIGTIKMMLDTGTKLAQSQASIIAKGQRLMDDELDDAFRPADPSPRFGDIRVHGIEGEQMPVRDRGKADRDHYNERARDEGSPTIGGR